MSGKIRPSHFWGWMSGYYDVTYTLDSQGRATYCDDGIWYKYDSEGHLILFYTPSDTVKYEWQNGDLVRKIDGLTETYTYYDLIDDSQRDYLPIFGKKSIHLLKHAYVGASREDDYLYDFDLQGRLTKIRWIIHENGPSPPLTFEYISEYGYQCQ